LPAFFWEQRELVEVSKITGQSVRTEKISALSIQAVKRNERSSKDTPNRGEESSENYLKEVKLYDLAKVKFKIIIIKMITEIKRTMYLKK
jgi:hypothetical protein